MLSGNFSADGSGHAFGDAAEVHLHPFLREHGGLGFPVKDQAAVIDQCLCRRDLLFPGDMRLTARNSPCEGQRCNGNIKKSARFGGKLFGAGKQRESILRNPYRLPPADAFSAAISLSSR